LVLKTLEDLGYYCVDNLPIDLISPFTDLYLKSRESVSATALGVDGREGSGIRRLPKLYEQLRREVEATLVFVEASDEALQRRFSETRRPHPLGAAVSDGIRRERRLLQPLRELADTILDTTDFNPHELRRFVRERFVISDTENTFQLSVMSFGYRHGLPVNADLVFDVRFLPNPHFVPAYRDRTGKDRRVKQYVFGFEQAQAFLDRVVGLLSFLLPQYRREGKSYLTVAFGCTGGRHRSVAFCEAVGKCLAAERITVKVLHRDVGKRP